jgi:hypothetical protein
MLASYDKKSYHYSFQKILKRYPQRVPLTYYIYAGSLSDASGLTIGTSIFFMVISAPSQKPIGIVTERDIV